MNYGLTEERRERRRRSAYGMGRNEGVGDQHLLGGRNASFGNLGNGQQRSVGALQARHLVRIAQTAVLPLLVIVPVHRNDTQAEQQENGDGASEDQLRSPGHTVDIIVLGL